MSGYYELKRSGDQYMFNLKAANHEVILTSERYTSKASALEGIASVRQNSPVDARYQRKTATNGSPFFNLTATNGQIIGHSEMYSSAAARDNGIESVKSNGPTPRSKTTPEREQGRWHHCHHPCFVDGARGRAIRRHAPPHDALGRPGARGHPAPAIPPRVFKRAISPPARPTV